MLLLILGVGAFLRFYHFSDFSFSNDELSAVLRLQFDDFGSLISDGVRIDGHPAFTQVTMWLMSRSFGISEGTMRILPVIAGILALFWTYKLGKKMFSASTGLLAAAVLCSLEYVLMYTQLARPYSFGLCFTLMFAYSWYLLLYEQEKHKWLKALFFGVSAALCMYTHYFAFLNALIIGLSGLFLVKKDTWLAYIAGALIAVVLFIPHFEILFFQMSVGGVGGNDGWLGVPDNLFFGEYILNAFNGSGWVLLTVLGFAVIVYLQNKKREGKVFHPLMMAWFLAPFLIGFLYSVLKNPVLQYSTLLFSFPFALLALFSFAPELDRKKSMGVIVVLLVISGAAYTITDGYYKTNQFGVFSNIAEANVEWEDYHGDEGITQVVNVNNPYYIEHYLQNEVIEVEYADTRIDNNPGELAAFVDLVRNCKTPYFSYGWSSKYSAAEIPNILLDYYPEIEDERSYFNSGVTLFKKGESKPARNGNTIRFIDFSEVKKRVGNWQMDESKINGSAYQVGDNEYNLTLATTPEELGLEKGKRIHIVANIDLPEGSDGHLVFGIRRGEEQIDYHSYPLTYFIRPGMTGGNVHLNRVMNKRLMPDDEIKIFVWNPAKNDFTINSIDVSVFEEELR